MKRIALALAILCGAGFACQGAAAARAAHRLATVHGPMQEQQRDMYASHGVIHSGLAVFLLSSGIRWVERWHQEVESEKWQRALMEDMP